MNSIYHVYIMASASRVLYVGVTGHLLRRVREHKEKRISGFTARYRVTELVYFEALVISAWPSRGRSNSKDGCAQRRSRWSNLPIRAGGTSL